MITYCILLPIFAFVLGFFIQLPISKNAADNLFLFKSFEKNGKGYERIGVRAFKNLLIRSGYNAVMQKAMKVKDGDVKELEHLSYLMQQAELIHFFGCILSIAISFWFLHLAIFYPFVTITISNIIFNVYPLLLQRYNRLRVKRIISTRGKTVSSLH